MLRFLLLGILGLGLSRLALMGWQWNRVADEGAPLRMLLMGLRCDLIVLGWLLAPVALLLPVFLLLRRMRAWIGLSSAWLALGLMLILFLELSTPSFIAQYDLRPNRLFLEYLSYPREVFSMLVDGFAASLILVTLAAFALGSRSRACLPAARARRRPGLRRAP